MLVLVEANGLVSQTIERGGASLLHDCRFDRRLQAFEKHAAKRVVVKFQRSSERLELHCVCRSRLRLFQRQQPVFRILAVGMVVVEAE